MAEEYANGLLEQEQLEEKLAPVVIEVVEIFTRAAMKFVPERELAACIPDDAKNEETARAFSAQGAPTLAQLCRK
jgi:hypothetical protein